MSEKYGPEVTKAIAAKEQLRTKLQGIFDNKGKNSYEMGVFGTEKDPVLSVCFFAKAIPAHLQGKLPEEQDGFKIQYSSKARIFRPLRK